jgi:hypothetical protein
MSGENANSSIAGDSAIPLSASTASERRTVPSTCAMTDASSGVSGQHEEGLNPGSNAAFSFGVT